MAGDRHEFRGDRDRRGNRRGTFDNGFWWPYGDWWGDYSGGGYYGDEAGPGYAEPPGLPGPPMQAAPICPELFEWSAKLGKAIRYRLCDDPSAASSTH